MTGPCRRWGAHALHKEPPRRYTWAVPKQGFTIEPFVNKTAELRFDGRDLRFHLSHGLFSSFDVDEGTRLLLKSIAQRVDLETLGSCLDVGCGVGVIGISIKARAAQARVVMQDRDALAAAFARDNSLLNGQAQSEVDCGLAFWHLAGRRFDLVTSNLPAKAGTPVLESFFRQAPAFLTPQGIAAVVIVAPLARLALSTVTSLGHEVLYSESTKAYTVLHFRAGAGTAEAVAGPSDTGPSDSLEPYIRLTTPFTAPGAAYELQTAWSLPDFDTVGHAVSLAFDALSEITLKGDVLFWNPGQGHLPAFMLARLANAVSGISLASRDFLQLAATEHNLRGFGRSARRVSAVASESGLRHAFADASFDFLCAMPQPIPRAPWQANLAEAARGLLRPGGRVLVVSKSTEIHRFLEYTHGLQLVRSKKRYGERVVVLKA
jgi:SAM-dependent methyltransferase